MDLINGPASADAQDHGPKYPISSVYSRSCSQMAVMLCSEQRAGAGSNISS